MRLRYSPLDAAMLIVAIIGPVFHLMGIGARGVVSLYDDTTRLGLIYIVLAAASGASAYLLQRRGYPVLRALAGIALLANLGSTGYAGRLWRDGMERSLTEASMVPMSSEKYGILVSPADAGDLARDRARALEMDLKTTLRQLGLEGYCEIRQVYPITSAELAKQAARRINADMVIWQLPSAGRSAEYRLTVVGGNQTSLVLEPLNVMLLMSGLGTWVAPDSDGTGSRLAESASPEALEPMVGGFAALALGQPVSAAFQFDEALHLEGIGEDAAHVLHDLRGTALMVAGRVDLATAEYGYYAPERRTCRDWTGLGSTLIARREWGPASEAFLRALALDAYDPLPYCGLGVTAGVEHRVARALALYEQALGLDPDSGGPWALLGLAYELEGNSEGYLAAYQQCANLAGSNVGLYLAAKQRTNAVSEHPPTAVPTATPRPRPSPTPVPTSALYTVERNDTLQAIADKFEISMDALVDANELDDPNAIYIGQQLIIPKMP